MKYITLFMASFMMLFGFANQACAGLQEEFSEHLAWFFGDDDEEMDMAGWNNLEKLSSKISKGSEKLEEMLDKSMPDSLIRQSASSLKEVVKEYYEDSKEYLSDDLQEQYQNFADAMESNLEEIKTLIGEENMVEAKQALKDFMNNWKEAKKLVQDNIEKPTEGGNEDGQGVDETGDVANSQEFHEADNVMSGQF